MTRTKLIAGNWKMNNTFTSATQLVSDIAAGLPNALNAEVWIAAPYVYINTLAENTSNTPIRIGAQDISTHVSGAYTGEISGEMLHSVGAYFVLVGHSERRNYFGETDEIIATKIDAALNSNLIAVYCCGETLEEREAGNHFDIIKTQLHTGLFNFSELALNNIVIAYEPVWAIGTGLTASPEQAQEIHAFIRTQLLNKFGAATADKMRILYGGSLKPNNAAELLAQPDIDGGLIGGASLVEADFNYIINAASTAI